jgi:hypothetical protein
MPWHHIIPRHEWLRRFGNLLGFDDPDNQVNLSFQNHTEIHKRYGEEGSAFDLIAGRAMSGMIGREEAYLLAVSQPKSKEHREAIRSALIGKKHSKDRIERNRIGHLTQTFSLEHRKKISKSNTGRIKPLVKCPNCGKIGGCNVMPRYHFDNCKKKS